MSTVHKESDIQRLTYNHLRKLSNANNREIKLEDLKVHARKEGLESYLKLIPGLQLDTEDNIKKAYNALGRVSWYENLMAEENNSSNLILDLDSVSVMFNRGESVLRHLSFLIHLIIKFACLLTAVIEFSCNPQQVKHPL